MPAAASPPLTLAHLAVLEVGPPELFDLMAAAGYASVCLRMRRTAPGSPEYPLAEPSARREAKTRMAAAGVSLFAVELVSLGRDLDVASIEPMLAAGAELGAGRLVVAGDDPDFDIATAKLVAVCELARRYRIAVDLEFMPFRAVRSLHDAVRVLAAAGQPNAHILLDALHFYRSASSIEQLRRLDPRLLGAFQICDAPAAAPADLTHEARNARLLPGEGQLDLDTLMDALPPGLALGVEVPLALAHPDLDHLARARLTVARTRAFLARRAARPARV